MSPRQALRTYLIGAIIVWSVIFIATGVILSGTDYFGQLLPVLAGGAIWAVIIVPFTIFRRR